MIIITVLVLGSVLGGAGCPQFISHVALNFPVLQGELEKLYDCVGGVDDLKLSRYITENFNILSKYTYNPALKALLITIQRNLPFVYCLIMNDLKSIPNCH